ncbi:hypothetical protein CRE_19520 [Caenorhabditis remanei]|uniref:Sdz-33 F-box domain-containing protein n=1 Tax=Caenorhabditis remanei TaxID=31234 RepID=E3NHZ6_CAERE|nr:hypothetical protein CRE_19520 [Caenorhabditis remanei]
MKSVFLDVFVDKNVSIIDFLKTNVKSVNDCNLFQWEDKNYVDEHAAYLLENIKIDSVKVIIGTHRISNNEWNLFFKKWIAMETHLNLELLAFDFKLIEEFKGLVLYDIPHEVVDEGVKRILITYRDEKTEINGGIDIRRVDGKTATFFSNSNSFSMSVH